MLWNILTVVATGYIGFALLLFLTQSRLVYYPEIGREISVTPENAGLNYEPVTMTTADRETLQGWFVPAQKPRGVVLFLHGNAGNISHRLESLLMFHRLGLSTFIFDYRGYGNSTGSPSEEGTYLDAEAAWNYLNEARHISPKNIVVFGESLGGAVAAWLAARNTPGALILASVFTSVPDLGAKIYPFLPVRLLARFQYNTREYLNFVNCPVFIAHSRNDEIVPFEHGRMLYETAKEPKQFLEMQGGHNDGFLFVRQAWVDALGAFLDQHIGRRDQV